jgi:hypothetical protein
MDATHKYITIPIPRMTQNLYRGFVDKPTPETQPVSVRWTDSDRRFIDQQAGVLGISFSEFVRWCAVYTAVEINKMQRVDGFALMRDDELPKQKVDMSGFE